MHALRILRGGTRARLSATPGDLVFEGLSTLVALSVVGLLVVITVILYLVAQESIRVNGLRFLTDTIWDSVSQRFGAAPFIYGMLVTSGIALLLGVPVSLGIAIFLSELAPPWLRIPLTFIVELLAAVPRVGRRRDWPCCDMRGPGSSALPSWAWGVPSGKRWRSQ